MTTIEHSLKFVTELDETHPIGIKLLRLPEEMRLALLEGMLKELLVPALAPILADLNENNSYATLKVAE